MTREATRPADPGLMDPRDDSVDLEVGRYVLRLRRRTLHVAVVTYVVGAFLLGALSALGVLAAIVR